MWRHTAAHVAWLRHIGAALLIPSGKPPAYKFETKPTRLAVSVFQSQLDCGWFSTLNLSCLLSSISYWQSRFLILDPQLFYIWISAECTIIMNSFELSFVCGKWQFYLQTILNFWCSNFVSGVRGFFGTGTILEIWCCLRWVLFN